MLAKDLDKGLLVSDPSAPDDDDRRYYVPPQKVPSYKAFEEVGKVWDRDIHARGWDIWLSFVTANPELLEQDIRIEIPQLYRIKDRDGKEWLYYHKNMYGKDHEDNVQDFPEMEGFVEIPHFHIKRDPITKKVKPESTTVQEIVKEYTIPFNKAKLEELSKYFANPIRCAVVSQNGTRLSCSLSEFRDMPYDELVDDKNMYAEFARQKRAQKSQKVYQ